MSDPKALPIDELIPRLDSALARQPSAVVVAAPGVGKTTRIPLAVYQAPWLAGRRIVMLEPRRLAARLAAERMARSLGARVGDTIGYQVRFEARVSEATRIEVVTEGIYTRRIQDDPELKNVGLVIFDEFHERSLDADLGLALTLDARHGLRPDLRILVMSATIDANPIATLLGGAPILESAHRPHPVATHYLGRDPSKRLEDSISAAVARALAEDEGSVLVFLPGEREIRRCVEALPDARLPSDVDLAPLYGALPWAEQTRAVEPAPPGRRKVVLATTIAETSLTIEGVRIVIDSGLKRVPRFDPGRGMSELATVRVSRAAAEQRRGRAGRLGPGLCYRLWHEAEDRSLLPFDEPEIANADLAPLALNLAAWGVGDPARLTWLTPPPAGAYAQATDLLRGLGAIDGNGRLTDEGRAMTRLPLHPRLSHMIRKGLAIEAGMTACDLAAVLSERDFLTAARDPDLRRRLTALHDGSAPARIAGAARQVHGLVRPPRQGDSDGAIGRLVAAAYPDRIGQARDRPGTFRLSGGGSATLDAALALARSEFVAIADLDGASSNARIFLAAPLDRSELEDDFAEAIVKRDEVNWDDRLEAVVARRVRRLGALVLDEQPLSALPDGKMEAAVLTGVRSLGLSALPWSDDLARLRHRVAFARAVDWRTAWPDLGDAALLASLETWLQPYIAGITRRSQFGRIDLRAALSALLPWPLPNRLDDIAPARVVVPSGSAIDVDYGAEGGPALAVKLQEVFGQSDTPTVGGEARVAVTLHLLSPARRPLAVTRDLASFWRNAYTAVRAEMRGRYPKHVWPENPMAATPTRRSIKPRA